MIEKKHARVDEVKLYGGYHSVVSIHGMWNGNSVKSLFLIKIRISLISELVNPSVKPRNPPPNICARLSISNLLCRLSTIKYCRHKGGYTCFMILVKHPAALFLPLSLSLIFPPLRVKQSAYSTEDIQTFGPVKIGQETREARDWNREMKRRVLNFAR